MREYEGIRNDISVCTKILWFRCVQDILINFKKEDFYTLLKIKDIRSPFALFPV